MAQKEKEERVLREKRERPLSTSLGTTSTDAMDTEEAQEFSKEIAKKAMERELKKQKYEQYQQIKQTSNYQVPRSINIPVPDLNKPRQEKEGRLTSVLSNFDVPLYEEVLGPKEGQPIRCSMSVTPGRTGMKCGEGARPKDSSNRVSAFCKVLLLAIRWSGLFLLFSALLLLLQLCQRFLLLWLCSNVLRLLGNVVRVP